MVFDAQSLKNSTESIDSNRNSTDGESFFTDNANMLNFDQIKFPYGIGIAGYVASTGVALNIQDAYMVKTFY